jgi:hypothetical protein
MRGLRGDRSRPIRGNLRIADVATEIRTAALLNAVLFG